LWLIYKSHTHTPSSYYQLVNEDDEERVVMCCIDYMLRDYDDIPFLDFNYEVVYNNIKLIEEKEYNAITKKLNN